MPGLADDLLETLVLRGYISDFDDTLRITELVTTTNSGAEPKDDF